ncbi:MAG: tRNA(Ile)(2)-agmatinylcytidine synthase [Candidatus Bathyarchaeia archaeon]
METKIMHIGIDDTDSTRTGCTTYVAALLVEELEKLGVSFIDYPNLIRLNPNIPWKTRGNGALCLRIEYAEKVENHIKETTINLVEKNSDIGFKGTDPGIVFLTVKHIPQLLATFAKQAITDVVTLRDALKIIKKFGGEAIGFNTCRGVVGALAAIGETLQDDYTYELLAYRIAKNRGLKRKIDEASVLKMDELTQPYTYNNVDKEKHRIIITPRGPDPILFGIRGETPEVLKKALGIVKPLEPIERWVIFRTNQGTDAHLVRKFALKEVKPFTSVIVKGVVSRNPHVIPLRHVIFSIRDSSGEVACAAYEPTGSLRKVAMQLVVGDEVEVYGAVRKPSQSTPVTINLEKINILSIAPKFIFKNPFCPQGCGKRLKSMGKNQGFRCEKCGSKFIDLKKDVKPVNRGLNIGLYITSTRSQRHLTKPLRRYGLEKHCWHREQLIEGWHS